MLRLKKCRYQPFFGGGVKNKQGGWDRVMVFYHGLPDVSWRGGGGRKISLTTSGGFQKSKGKIESHHSPHLHKL